MAKITWVFQDESGTNLNRYIATNVETGEQVTFDLLRGGNISIVGTPLNAEKLNSLIDSINILYDYIQELVVVDNKLSNRISNLELYYLGNLSSSPTKTDNTTLNSINKAGVYTFTYSNEAYLLIHSYGSLGNEWSQCILKGNHIELTNKGYFEVFYRTKIKDIISGEFSYKVTAKSDLATKDYVDEQLGKKHLYEHNMRFAGTTSDSKTIIYFTILNTDETELTYTTIRDYLPQNTGESIPATGVYYNGTTVYTITAIYYAGNYIAFKYNDMLSKSSDGFYDNSKQLSFTSITNATDFVRQIY